MRWHGRWVFEAARRGRSGRYALVWGDRPDPEAGDWCVVELDEDQRAHLIEVLGAEDRPDWDDLAIASEFRLRQRFPANCLREAERARAPDAEEIARRLDLRHLFVFTIDPADARDHDDALSIEPESDQVCVVGIHIADVSHYVAPDSAIDREAVARGTSCYLPSRAIPMLPERLSAELCSLRPEEDRFTLSVLARVNSEGEVLDVRFEEAVIRSRHRLAYEEVEKFFRGKAELEPGLADALGALQGLARVLRARRLEAGALELNVAEVRAVVDSHGAPVRIERRERLESHELVEEFMLLANRLVGSEGARRNAGLLYRIHEPPSPRRLEELDRVLKTLGLPRLGPGRDPAAALQALLRVSLDPPHRRLLHRMVLRAMARARYLERDLGHFGLAAREYCHFTSPIRRYPDLHNHRRVREWIRQRRSAAWDPTELEALAEACSACEQNATDAEREATKVKGLRLLEGRLGDNASGIITGFLRHGFFVELDDVPVEGFVRPSTTLDDYFVLDVTGVRMVGRRSRRRFTLGDPVRVMVARVDVAGRECELALDAPPRRSRHERRRKR